MARLIEDKEGKMIDIHECLKGGKLSILERDQIYQRFLLAFPSRVDRKGILREFRDASARRRALAWFEQESRRVSGRVTAKRIHDFVCEATATEFGVLKKSERWDWWVGCSLSQQS